MGWASKLTAKEREHLRTHVVPLHGLYSKKIVIEKLRETLVYQRGLGSNWVCPECQELLRKIA